MTSPRMSSASVRPALAALVALSVASLSLAVAAPAAAATTLTVNTSVDVAAPAACTDTSVTTPGSTVSLRAALCLANNIGGESTITVPAGTYTLNAGPLVVGTEPGTTVDLSSTGGRAVVVGDGASQLMIIDADPTDGAQVGGIEVSIDGFEFRGGRDDVYGGAAIIAGNAGEGDADVLSITDTLFTDNHAIGGSFNIGGAIQFIGGDLTITDSTFLGNSTASASGGAVYYEAMDAADSIRVTDSRFIGNSVSAGPTPVSGGALAIVGNAAGTARVDENVFSGNSVSPTNGHGAALSATGSLTAQFNSFTGNTGLTAVAAGGVLTNNWWGCNLGPNQPGCATTTAVADAAPFLTFTARANDDTMPISASTDLSASMRTNSAGLTLTGDTFGAFDGVPVSWSTTGITGASVAPATTSFRSGTSITSFTAGTVGGTGSATATIAGAAATVPLTVRQDVTLTGPTSASGVMGQSFTLTVTAAGYPAPVFQDITDALPPGLDWAVSGNTMTISGVPTGTGSFPVTISASNGGVAATHDVTITVGTMPGSVTPSVASVAAGDAVDITLTVPGQPAPTLSVSGSLPAGLSFTDNGDGTARLLGTPTVAPGVHTIVVSATNTAGTVNSSFLLTVTAPPRFISPGSATFQAGTSGAFPVLVDPGFPVMNVVSLTDAPGWLVLSGPAGSQQLIGSPPVGSGGVHDMTLTIAGSGVTQAFRLTVDEAPMITASPTATAVLAGSDATFTASATGYPAPTVQWQRSAGGSWTDIAGATSTTLTIPTTIADDGMRVRAAFTNASATVITAEAALSVGQLPSLDAIAPVGVLAGGPLTIDVTSTGLPHGAITASGVPAWLTFTDDADGTATLTGTPALTDAGSSQITLRVDNGYGSDDITVDVTVASEVPLPFILGLADGPLSGVPASVRPGQQVTIGGTGFLAGAVVNLGIYSTPTALGTAVADPSGAFSATVTIPADMAPGAHTVAAIGISAQGAARLLIGSTTVPAPTADTGSNALPETGLDGAPALGLTLLALIAALGGLALMRAARRRIV